MYLPDFEHNYNQMVRCFDTHNVIMIDEKNKELSQNCVDKWKSICLDRNYAKWVYTDYYLTETRGHYLN